MSTKRRSATRAWMKPRSVQSGLSLARLLAARIGLARASSALVAGITFRRDRVALSLLS